ncbi:MAG: DUF1987 domain-containing protein [Bacteroidales bacterium]|nr:DUF1987 domain-containing protein [Bacteroidales bacterium]MDD4671783.1 DUF1987 domain-containing protein [Bacteroidales bacterium]MDY0347357.1 DUF1987 domain-containing protein [Tenuifilaceae bacterium]
MDILKIKGTSHYPEISLNAETGKIEFSGNSLPENAKDFYEPINSWVSSYIEAPCEETVVEFRMTYYNTPSSKTIFVILKKLELIHGKTSNVKILWYYPDDDIDMKYAGKDYSESIEIPFELIPYQG